MDILRRYREQTAPSRIKKRTQLVGLENGSAVTNLIIKLSGGKIRDEKTANYVMLGLSGVCLLVTAFILFSTLSGPSTAPPSQNESTQPFGFPQ